MTWKSKLAHFIGEHESPLVGAGIVVAVVGAALAIETHNILIGIVSAVLTAILMVPLWPLLKRWG